MIRQREWFTERPFLPARMATDLLFLYYPPCETRILSAPRPLIPSGPGQRAEAREASPAASHPAVASPSVSWPGYLLGRLR
jgi:hypothetical protein